MRWEQENYVGDVAHIAFPAAPVWISGPGEEAALAGPNHAMFFNAGDWFRRRRFNGHGDRNLFMVVSEDTMAGVAGATPASPSTSAKLLPRPYMTVRALARAIADDVDALAVEERLLALGHATVTGAFGRGEYRIRRRTPAVVEDAKALLTARYDRAPHARRARPRGERVAVPPRALVPAPHRLHAARVPHPTAAASRARPPRARATRTSSTIARAVGYSSHSHLTASFRRVFGVPPSRVRRRLM